MSEPLLLRALPPLEELGSARAIREPPFEIEHMNGLSEPHEATTSWGSEPPARRKRNSAKCGPKAGSRRLDRGRGIEPTSRPGRIAGND